MSGLARCRLYICGGAARGAHDQLGVHGRLRQGALADSLQWQQVTAPDLGQALLVLLIAIAAT